MAAAADIHATILKIDEVIKLELKIKEDCPCMS